MHEFMIIAVISQTNKMRGIFIITIVAMLLIFRYPLLDSHVLFEPRGVFTSSVLLGKSPTARSYSLIFAANPSSKEEKKPIRFCKQNSCKN